MKQLFLLFAYLIISFSIAAQCNNNESLATPINSNNGQRGVMFDITANNFNIEINSFDALLYAGTTANYEIYYKSGSYIGSENNAGNWTLLGSVTNLTSLGNSQTTPIPIALNVLIPAGQTFGFYITNDFGGGVLYRDGVTASDDLGSNSDISITGGVGKSYPFGLSFSYRQAMLTAHYSICPQIASGISNQCNSGVVTTVDGTGNAGNWVHISDATGDIIASIENTENLGDVNTEFYTHNDGNRINTANENYLGRNIKLSVDNQPTNPVKVRFYFLDSEYTALQNATNTVVPNSQTISDLHITKYDLSTCSSDYINAGTNRTSVPNITQGQVFNGHFIETTVSSFSQFFIHESFNGPLPVELVSFKGRAIEEGNLLTWQTASEENNEGFEIEKSSNGLDWEYLDFIAGQGTTSTINNYDFLDEKIKSGVSYYRLKQVDWDGEIEYSEVVAITRRKVVDDLSVYPNPASNVLNLEGISQGQYSIVNTLGQVLKEGELQNEQQIDISALKLGRYFLYLIPESGDSQLVEFIKM